MPELNLGKVVGPQGPMGLQGYPGDPGPMGPPGATGAPATINGINVLTLAADAPVKASQSGNTLTIGLEGGTYSNINLLDNWYFADPIDQREGRIVNSGVTYYSDSALTTSAGTTTAAMTVTNGAITINGTTYYVAAADVVRGYARIGNTIDRWLANVYKNPITVKSGYLSVGADNYVIQRLPTLSLYKGLTLTFSLLLLDGTLISCTGKISNQTGTATVAQNGNAKVNIELGLNTDEDWIFVGVLTKSSDRDCIAAKLELGSQQTLAHQDTSGNWVLNDPPPNKALELAKCQRFQSVLKAPSRGGNITLGEGTLLLGNNIYISLPLGPFRIIPAEIKNSSGILVAKDLFSDSSKNKITRVAFPNYRPGDQMITAVFSYPSGTVGETYRIGLLSGESLIFDANL